MSGDNKLGGRAAARPPLRASLAVDYADGSTETVIVKRLSNTDMIRWVDSGFSKPLLVFRSVEREDAKADHGQEWFDMLTQESAYAVVEKALELNHGHPIQKKTQAATLAMLESFASVLQSSSSPAAGTTSAS